MVSTLDVWNKLSDDQRKKTAADVAAAMGKDWRAVKKLRGKLKLAAVEHVASKTEFVVVPGGTYTAGVRPDDVAQVADIEWSEDESGEWVEQAAEAQPPREVTVKPFLCARAPVLAGAAEAIAGDKAGWVVGNENSEDSPIRFTKAQCAPILKKIAWRLPTGDEWEWVARDGGVNAFINGATPDDAEKACNALYGAAYDNERTDRGVNGFGVWGMPWGDWIAKPGKPREPHAGRGGAAMLFPWQSDEIIMQLAGMGDDACANKEQCLRFVIDLPASLVDATPAKPAKATKDSKTGVAMMAIVSKAIFEKDMPGAKVGDVYKTDRYTSSNKALAQLGNAGTLYLVTVRPPDEKLWLVAVLENVKHDGSAWIATKPNKTPITDISKVRGKLVFASGQPLPKAKGKLGMSLQTPRVLTREDVAALRTK